MKINYTVIFLLLTKTLFAQINSIQIDSVVNEAMRVWKIPGVAVGIVYKDSIVYSKGFGVTDLAYNKVVNEKTVFPIWSMSKSFTSFALSHLEQQQKIQLDSPVINYGNNYFKNLWRSNPTLNAIDLLAHRTGLETFQGDFLWTASNLSEKQLVSKWPSLNTCYPNRSGFHYNNMAYLMAGKLIQEVSKLCWQDYLQSNVFSIMGLKNVITNPKFIVKHNNRAIGHSVVNDSLITINEGKIPRIESFGGMYADIGSILSWLKLHLNKGKIDDKQLFPPAIFERVLTSQNSIGEMFLPDGSHPKTYYSLGWELRDYYGKKVFSHGGAYSGFLSMMGFVPELQLGFVILTNSDSHELGEVLRWQVIDAAMGRTFVNYIPKIKKYLDFGIEVVEKEKRLIMDTLAMNLPTSLSINKFTGIYKNSIYGKIYIKKHGRYGLIMTFQHHPQLKASLYHLGGNRFYTVYNQSVFGTSIIPFNVQEKQVKTFKLFINPSVEFKEYIFHKVKTTKT